MKRSIAILLLLAMMLGVFAGCGKQPAVEPTDAPATTPAPTEETIPADAKENLAAAAEYLKTYYKDALTLTGKDYTRLGAVRVGLDEYPITWSVNVSEDIIKIVVNDDGSVTIDIADGIKEEVPYVLTATLTDAYGNVETVDFEYTIPASLGTMQEIVDLAYALEKGDALPVEVTLTGEITSINTPYDAGYKNVSVVIKVAEREDYPILCYRLKGEGADTITVGDTITVTGIIKNYNGTIEFDAGCTLDEVVKGNMTFDLPSDPKEIVDMAYALGVGESIPVKVTLTGKVSEFKETYTDQYKNISVWMQIEGRESKPILVYRLKGDEVAQVAVGDTITVSGSITNYKGTIEYTSGCTLDSRVSGGGTPPAPTVSNYWGTVVEAGEAYYLYMNIKGVNYYFTGKMSGNYLASSTNSGDAVEVYVEDVYTYAKHIYFMDNGVKKYIEVYEYTRDDGKLKGGVRIVDTPSNVFWYDPDAHVWVVYGSTNDAYFMGTYGNFDTFSVSSTYYITGNNAPNAGVTQYIGDFMKVADAPAPEEPPVVEDNYVTEPVVGTAYKLGLNQTQKSAIYYFTGAMSGFYGATDTDITKGVEVYLEKATDGYYLYFLDASGAKQYIYVEISGTHTNFKFGATGDVFTWDAEKATLATVEGEEVCYMGTYGSYVTFGGLTTSKLSDDTYFAHLYPSDGSTPEQPEEPAVTELTIAEAAAKGAAMTHNTTTTEKYQVTGVIESVASTTYGNMTISDGNGNTLYIYGTWSADGSLRYDAMDVKPVAGDTVTLVGVIGNYNGAQMKNAWIVAHTPAGSEPEQPEQPEEPTVKELTIAEAYAMGAAMTHNTTTTEKYQVTGVIESVASTTYGNMTISDGNGNTLYIYGTWSADGSTRYDALEVKPVAGDTVTLVGVIGNYNGAQMKNAWIVAHTPAGSEPEQPEQPEQPEDPVTPVASNKADFETIVTSNPNGDSGYTNTYTTTNGWVTKNSAIQCGGPAGCSNPQYEVIGPNNTYKAVCLNGKTSAPGSLTSPTLTGGISKLTMKYTKMFTDTKLSATITITDLATGAVYTNTAAIEWEKSTKYEIETFEWTLETPITGDFTIVVVNDCPTGQNTNKDRMTVLELAWEGAEADPDQEAADAVIALIDAIGEVTLEKEEAIVAARAAYEALTDDQKSLVTNLETLTAAEAALEELKKPAVPTNPVEIVKAAYALAEGESLPYTATLTGTIVAVNEDYNATYSNITVEIVVAGAENYPIKCFRLKGEGADTLNVNDIITVTGTLKNYYKTIEFDQGCTLDAVVQMDPPAPPVVEGVELSFASKSNRTAQDSNHQIWEQNGIKLTNNKGSSTSNVADYYNPARFYKSSQIIVEYKGMTKIEFICNSSSYATALKNSIKAASGVTVTISGSKVTVEFESPVDSYEIASLTGGQVRMNELVVYAG